MYRVVIEEPNFTLEAPNGKILRTPLDFVVKDQDKDFWDMTIKMSGIRIYTITEFEKPAPPPEPEKPPVISHKPVRPSTAKGK